MPSFKKIITTVSEINSRKVRLVCLLSIMVNDTHCGTRDKGELRNSFFNLRENINFKSIVKAGPKTQ